MKFARASFRIKIFPALRFTLKIGCRFGTRTAFVDAAPIKCAKTREREIHGIGRANSCLLMHLEYFEGLNATLSSLFGTFKITKSVTCWLQCHAFLIIWKMGQVAPCAESVKPYTGRSQKKRSKLPPLFFVVCDLPVYGFGLFGVPQTLLPCRFFNIACFV